MPESDQKQDKARPSIATMVLGKAKPPAEAPKEPEEGEGDPEDIQSVAFDDAASEVFDAAKSGDMRGFRDALKSAIRICLSDRGY